MSSLCIHGFVSAETPLTFEANDIAGGLRLCAEGGIAAIVAAAPECGFHQLPREQAASLLLRHQQVLEAAMAQTTVLPAKFGTSAPDEQAVRRMLIQGNPLLGTQLADFAGRLQMEIVVLWPLDKIFAEIAADAKIADLRSRAQASSDAAMKTQLGEAVKAALDQRRASLSEEICSVLRGAAIDMAVNPIMDDRIVANVALLINKGDLCHLETVLERLDAENDGQLIFRCIGPLPPANFATVGDRIPATRSNRPGTADIGAWTAGQPRRHQIRLSSPGTRAPPQFRRPRWPGRADERAFASLSFSDDLRQGANVGG